MWMSISKEEAKKVSKETGKVRNNPALHMSFFVYILYMHGYRVI